MDGRQLIQRFSILKRILKIFVAIAVAVMILFGTATWIVFQNKNDLLLDQLEAFMDQSQSGELEIGALDLSLFRNFPDITVRVDNIYYWERRDSLRPDTTLPILRADNLFVGLDFWSLVKGSVEISRISLQGGTLHLVEYKGGDLNLDRALAKPGKPMPAAKKTVVKKPTTEKPITKPVTKPKPKVEPQPVAGMKVALKAVDFNNLRLTWESYHDPKINAVLVKKLEVALDQTDSVIAATVASAYTLEDVRFNKTQVPSGDLSLEARVRYEKKNGRLIIEGTSLSLDVFTATATGIYEHTNNRNLDINIDASTNDLPFLSKLLKKNALQNNKEILKSGDIFLKGRVYGPLKKQLPQFDLSFGVSNLSFVLPKGLGAFRNLGFEGRLTSGSAPNYSGATLDIKNLKGQVPGGSIDGNFYISNFVRPYVRCKLNARLNLDGYDEVFHISRVQQLKGTVATNIRFDGPLRLLGLKANDIKPKFDASFTMTGISFRVPNHPGEYRGIGFEGNITSGPSPDLSQALLEVRNITGQVPGGDVNGAFRLTNLVEPNLSYQLGARVKLDGFEDLFQIDALEDLHGNATINASFHGPIKRIGTHAMDSSRASRVSLDSVSFLWNRTNQRVTDLHATLDNQNNRATANLAFNYGRNDLRLNLTLDNLMHRIFNEERIVEASGRVESNQLFTQDIIPDTVGQAAIDDRISNLALDFKVSNASKSVDGKLQASDFRFWVKNLTAQLDQLPDIKKLNTSGRLLLSSNGPLITLNDLRLDLPQGYVAIKGNVRLPKSRQVAFDGKISINQLPWDYVREVADEIKDGVEPSRKNLSVKSMDLLTANLDLSALFYAYPFDFHHLEIREGDAKYLVSDGNSYSLQKFSGKLTPFSFTHPPNSGVITGIQSAAGTLRLEKLKIPGLIDLTLDMRLDGAMDTLDIAFTSISRKATSEDGKIQLNLSGNEPTYRVLYKVKETPVEAILRKVHKGRFLEGTIDYTIDLQSSGNSIDSIRENLKGIIEISGDSLDLYGVDIDDILTKFQKSQKFNLADLGAVVVAGPVGILATKGTDFVVLAAIDLNPDQHSRLQTLLARWTLEHQILKTEDVAFATLKNRMAIDGSIDFAQDSIPGIRVAVVDKNGCSLMDQNIYGSMKSLQHGKLNITKTLLGSVVNFVNAVVGSDCKPIYTGKVEHPGKD